MLGNSKLFYTKFTTDWDIAESDDFKIFENIVVYCITKFILSAESFWVSILFFRDFASHLRLNFQSS